MAKKNADPRSSSQLCPVCEKLRKVLVKGPMVREGVKTLIMIDLPTWDDKVGICLLCLEKYRTKYIEKILTDDKGELSKLDQVILSSFSEQQTITQNINQEYAENLTFGQRLADNMANFGGTWKFIFIFIFTLSAWIAVNSYLHRPFDPFPFILLNLILSCLAAIQAPIIMMGQNRQEARDRLRSESDYLINLKAELEIRQLHMKLDQFLKNHWQRLLEIQQMQLEILEEFKDEENK